MNTDFYKTDFSNTNWSRVASIDISYYNNKTDFFTNPEKYKTHYELLTKLNIDIPKLSEFCQTAVNKMKPNSARYVYLSEEHYIVLITNDDSTPPCWIKASV